MQVPLELDDTPHPQPHHHHNNNRRRLSLCGREHSCGQSPALLDPIRCATMHRNGSGTSVSRYPQPTDLIWMPAGSLRQLSVHQVQPAGVVFRDSDGPKAFRIRRTGPAAPARAGDDQDGFLEGCLAQIKVDQKGVYPWSESSSWPNEIREHALYFDSSCGF